MLRIIMVLLVAYTVGMAVGYVMGRRRGFEQARRVIDLAQIPDNAINYPYSRD